MNGNIKNKPWKHPFVFVDPSSLNGTSFGFCCNGCVISRKRYFCSNAESSSPTGARRLIRRFRLYQSTFACSDAAGAAGAAAKTTTTTTSVILNRLMSMSFIHSLFIRSFCDIGYCYCNETKIHKLPFHILTITNIRSYLLDRSHNKECYNVVSFQNKIASRSARRM